MGWVHRSLLLLIFTLAVLACSEANDERADRTATPARPAPTPERSAAAAAPNVATRPPGDLRRGARLAVEFECHRCHDGVVDAPVAFEQHCFRCHDDIAHGRVRAPDATLHRWQSHLEGLEQAPSLKAVGARLTREFLESYLTEPHDLRPHLTATMPRLRLDDRDVRDLVAYLTKDAGAEAASPAPSRDLVPRGLALFDAKQCGSCHAFSGAKGRRIPDLREARGQRLRAIRLAPDLAHARDRLRTKTVVRWLLDPKAVKPDTLMPAHGLTRGEAQALASYVLFTPLARTTSRPRVERPAPLSRPVGFAEVRERVFGRTCGHCHGNPDRARGDGGPGYSGGFGFPPRRMDLTTFEAVLSGYVADDGERHSVFEPLADGTPRLVGALLARHDELRGEPRDDVRGMPLGLPPVPLEDIQLVDAWLRQGRPR